jgi:hypothetical protein
VGLPRPLFAGAEPPIAWRSGTTLQKELAQPVDLFWSGLPLRRAITDLSHSRRVAVLIDRRVDPGQELEMTVSGMPLEEVLGQIADHRQLGLSWLGPVAYLGPPQVTRRVRTLAELRREEVARLPAAAGRKFLLPERIRWDDFATPRDLLSQLAAQNGIEISGLEQVPHDLWAQADLPAISLVDRLTLIAGQFDLTFQLAADGSAVALVPVPEDVAIERSYPGGRQPGQLAEKWAAMVPDAQIRVVSGEISVRGLLEDHEQIAAAPVRPPRPRPSPRAQPREGEAKTMIPEGRGKGQLGPVLEQLADRLDLELRIDREALQQAGISLEDLVSFSVKNATIDELLKAVLAPAGCTFRREGKVVEIRPAP